MTLRVLHLADLHLDSSFSGSNQRSGVSRERREGLRRALRRAFDLAHERHVDAVTIGGDLYEAERVSPDTREFLRQLFQQAAPIRVFIAPGNHDPYTHNSIYKNVDWPPNVHIFSEPRLTPVTLGESLEMWGAAHDSPGFFQPLLTNFRVPMGRPSLLLLHATDRNMAIGRDPRAFCPLSLDEIRSSGFTLALLGHIHHKNLTPQVNPLLCYPGSPEPLGFDEEVGHSVLLCEWDGACWNVHDIDISQWACRSLQVDVSELDSRDQVIEWIRELWKDERQARQCLARIVLTGTCPATLDLDLGAISTSLKTEFADVTLLDLTSPPFDLQALQAETTTTGEFVRRMRKELDAAKQRHDPERCRSLEKALRFGLLAMEGREITTP